MIEQPVTLTTAFDETYWNQSICGAIIVQLVLDEQNIFTSVTTDSSVSIQESLNDLTDTFTTMTTELVGTGERTYTIANNATLNSQIGEHNFTLKVYLEDYGEAVPAFRQQVLSVYVDKCMILSYAVTFQQDGTKMYFTKDEIENFTNRQGERAVEDYDSFLTTSEIYEIYQKEVVLPFTTYELSSSQTSEANGPYCDYETTWELEISPAIGSNGKRFY